MEKTLKQIAQRLRLHSMRATTESASGHPTSCLSAADLLAVLFFHEMRFDPKNSKDPRNDRFILSKGHAAPLLWGVFAELGIIEEKELLNLRKIDSNLEGHPTPRFPWVDVATGSLGQGLSVGVGMAFAGVRTYVLLGDGECAEGSVWEAAALAGHNHLSQLTAIVDINKLGQSQATMYQHDLESYKKKFEACGWQAITIDGHDIGQILAAFEQAAKDKKRPTAILAKTIKGKGISFLEGKDGLHGKALTKEELKLAEKEIGDQPKVAVDIKKPTAPLPKEEASRNPKSPAYKMGDKIATRASYGEALVKLGEADSRVVALDGDTKNSTFSEKFMKAYPDRFFECFIAEQNMVGVACGLAARGRIPFASTFGCFLARAHDQIRMAAISRLPIKLCGSHAGVSIGEDGPSQMALEDLAMMRSTAETAVLYPSDAVSTERLVFEAANYRGPVYIRTQRPATPVLYSNEETFPIGGSKVLKRSDKDKITVVAAGVTLIESLKAYEILKGENILIRVIDLYSIKPVDQKTLLQAAKETSAIVTVEDHYPEGGLGDAVLSALSSSGAKVYKLAVNQIPRSGKPEELMALCGIDAKAIVNKVKGLCI